MCKCFSATYVSSCENCLLRYVPLLTGLCISLISCFLSSSYNLDISLYWMCCWWKIFSHSVDLYFVRIMVFFAKQKTFIFMRSQLFIIDLSAYAICVLYSIQQSSVPIPSGLFLTFSSIGLSASGFVLKSLIHLQLSFVWDDMNGYIWILLHADVQFDQHHLLKILSFLQWIFLDS